ncbi:MAG: energy transducer TonB [Dysgonomonas sp.]|nr:energy transducer TonB [Dysgonomonas sp.]
MKKRSYHILFRIFSYLSDKTNGAPFFVKYKLIIGTLIIGLTATSCFKKKPEPTCYVPLPIEPEEVKGQDSVIPGKKDTIGITPPRIVKTDIPIEPEPLVTCYDVALVEDTIVEITTCYITIEVPEDKRPPKSEPADFFIYGFSETPPIPIEGDLDKFVEWVQSNIQYSEAMMINKSQGRVTTQFTIDTDGKLTDINIIRGISPEADAEAVRILSLSPPWTPGTNKGEKVKVKIVIPVTFRLPDN